MSSKKLVDKLEDEGLAVIDPGARAEVEEAIAQEKRAALDRAREGREREQRREEAEAQRRQEAQREDELRRSLEEQGIRVDERLDVSKDVHAFRLEPPGDAPSINPETGFPVGQYNQYRKKEREEFEPHPAPHKTASLNPPRSVVWRGCVLCGVRDVLANRGRHQHAGVPASGYCCQKCENAIDKWSRETDRRIEMARELAARGAGQLPATDFVALAVSERLRAERPDLDTGETTTGVVPGWESYVWCFRVLDSSDPAIQEPPSEPFGFLGAGPTHSSPTTGGEASSGRAR